MVEISSLRVRSVLFHRIAPGRQIFIRFVADVGIRRNVMINLGVFIINVDVSKVVDIIFCAWRRVRWNGIWWNKTWRPVVNVDVSKIVDSIFCAWRRMRWYGIRWYRTWRPVVIVMRRWVWGWWWEVCRALWIGPIKLRPGVLGFYVFSTSTFTVTISGTVGARKSRRWRPYTEYCITLVKFHVVAWLSEKEGRTRRPWRVLAQVPVVK